MHQTFYIDVDEEISSVIDRLNKSMSGDNFFVVPKRAIFLQSIVNLKLLKRESDKIGKRVTIITQDEVGLSMAQRAGINVRQNLEGIEPDESLVDDGNNDSEMEPEKEPENLEEAEGIVEKRKNIQNRLNGVGTEDFYDASEEGEEIKKTSLAKRISINSIAKKNLPKEISEMPLRKAPQTKIYKTIDTKNKIQSSQAVGYSEPILKPRENSLQRKQQLDPQKERTLEKMFSRPEIEPKRIRTEEVKKIKGGKLIKAIILFVVICLLLFLGVAAYLFIPRARVMVTPNILKDRIDVSFRSGDLSESEKTVPVRVIDKEESITLPYEVSGKNATSGKKAHGNVVIYNEFSSAPQSLVATTRLETSDGKIFRIIKGAVVPGTSKVGGETKPGAIEVEVAADQAGSDYNIEASDFKIPGFKDSPKYEKFYAKSTEAMTGGSSEGSTAAEGQAKISQADIDSAKAKTETAIKEKLMQSVSDELEKGEIALPDAEKITIKKSSADARIGNVVSSFNYTISASIRAIVFSENDAKNIIQKSSVSGSENAKKEISKIEYGAVQPDFDNSSLELKVHGEIISTPVIDADQIKKELLGKGTDQLGEILRKYSSIKNVNVEFQPAFISVIPRYSQRVSVEIKNE